MELLFLGVVALFSTLLTNAFNGSQSAEVHNENNSSDFAWWQEQQPLEYEYQEKHADAAYQRQVDFYNSFQSPQAMYNQYKQLGASDQASLMAALGIGSPSMSAPMASNSAPGISGPSFSPQGDVASLLSSFQNSANSWFNNQKTAAQTEQINISNQWQSTLNDTEVKKILFDMDMSLKRYGLDHDIYENVTKPTANSLIDLNTQEIRNKQAEWNNLKQEFFKIQAEARRAFSEANYFDAQSEYVSGALTDRTNAETGLVIQQTETEKQNTLYRQYEAKIMGFDARVSSLLGYNIHLDLPQSMNAALANAAAGVNQSVTDAADSIGKGVSNGFDKIQTSLDKQFNRISNGVEVAFKKGVAYLQNIDNHKRAVRYARSFFDGYFKGHSEYMRKRDRIFNKYDN